MESLTSGIINVRVDPKDKEKATAILNNLGLNMSTLINMTIKQVIQRNGIPFEVTTTIPNKEMEDALKESVLIEQEYKEGKRKGYNNWKDLKEALLSDEQL